MKNPELFLHLREERHAGMRGRLVTVETAVEDGRVCVLFEGDERPLLSLFQAVDVELVGSSLPSGVCGPARVLQHRVGAGASFYVLELPAPFRVALAGMFDRRGSERISPTAIAPIQATLCALDGSLSTPVVVKDISSTGVGLLLPPPENLGLLALPSMRLEFTLPGDGEPLELAVNLASRRPAGSEVLYGVAFDRAAGAAFAGAHARLRAWVAQRSTASAAA